MTMLSNLLMFDPFQCMISSSLKSFLFAEALDPAGLMRFF